jgi:hypothetical protein
MAAPERISACVTRASFAHMDAYARSRTTKCDDCLKVLPWNRVQAFRPPAQRDYTKPPLQLCDTCFVLRRCTSRT